MRTGQPDQTITKILALKQNEDDKNDDDPRGCEWVKQRGNKALQTLQCAWIGLADFHRNGFEWRSFRACARSRRARRLLGLVEFFAQVLQHAGRAFKRAPAGGGLTKCLDLLAYRGLISRQIPCQLRQLGGEQTPHRKYECEGNYDNANDG